VPGLLAAAAAGRVLASRLQRVSPLDPLTFGCTAAIVVAVVLLASYVPARRALGLDPVVATRAE
jgi:putative ABC transport system permease protein